MKAINDNGTIKVFNSTPKTWCGRIGLQYASVSELEAIGFYDVNKPSIKASQEYGDIEWDADNSRFTYPVNNANITLSISDLKVAKIEELKHIINTKLSATDWYVTRNQEKGTAIPSDVQAQRDDLRNDYETHKTAINSKTTKAAVVDYNLPSL